MASFSNIHSGLDNKGMYQKMILDPNANKYQENQMLFFRDSKTKRGKQSDLTRPRTIQEI